MAFPENEHLLIVMQKRKSVRRQVVVGLGIFLLAFLFFSEWYFKRGMVCPGKQVA